MCIALFFQALHAEFGYSSGEIIKFFQQWMFSPWSHQGRFPPHGKGGGEKAARAFPADGNPSAPGLELRVILSPVRHAALDQPHMCMIAIINRTSQF